MRALRASAVLVAGAWLPACSGPEEPTFAEDVAPILHERCASCHRPEGPAPFSLLTYEDARAIAGQIAASIEAGRMPPWLPAEGDVEFEGDRSLTGAERSTLLAWARGEPLPGDLGQVTPPEFPGGWTLGEPGVVVHTEEPYMVPAAGEDVFRNLVAAIPIEERVWVRGMEVRWEEPSVVHHAVLTLDPTPSSRIMDARDPEPGFDGMVSSTEAITPAGFLLGWTPGREPSLWPQDLAFPLQPGTDLVLQVHLRPQGEIVPVAAQVGIHLTDSPPSRTPFRILLQTQEIDIPAGDSAYRRADEYVLPVAVDVLGVYPHAHYLGKSIRLVAEPPDSSRLTVLDIPGWDFNWQDTYSLEEPLRLEAGTRLEARWVWDNSSGNPMNPSDPPVRVTFGPQSDDEMGEVWVQVVPVNRGELALLQEDFARKDLRAKIAGWRHTLKTRGDDPIAHVGLGTVAQGEGRHEEAIAHFEAALADRPDMVLARYNLALSLERLGRMARARAEYERAVRDEPRYAPAHNNLGLIAASDGRLAEAVRHFRAAAEASPRFPEAHNNLGNALRQMGDLDGAGRSLARALELAPGYSAARLNLALVAWTRATHPDAAVRDGGEAVRWAELAASGAGGADPRILDVLAAAYAEAGRFEDAARMAERAVEAARRAGSAGRELARQIQERLEGYRAGRPYRSG